MRQLIGVLGTTLVVLLLASWATTAALAAFGIARTAGTFWIDCIAMIGVYAALRLTTRERIPRI